MIRLFQFWKTKPSFVSEARATLRAWKFKESDLTDDQAVRLFARELRRRYKAVGDSAASVHHSLERLSKGVRLFGLSMEQATCPMKERLSRIRKHSYVYR